MSTPSLEAFKANLDGDLGSLSWWVTALSWTGFGIRCALMSLPTQTVLWFYFSSTARRVMIVVLFPADASLITLSYDLNMLILFSYYFLVLKKDISSSAPFKCI